MERLELIGPTRPLCIRVSNSRRLFVIMDLPPVNVSRELVPSVVTDGLSLTELATLPNMIPVLELVTVTIELGLLAMWIFRVLVRVRVVRSVGIPALLNIVILDIRNRVVRRVSSLTRVLFVVRLAMANCLGRCETMLSFRALTDLADLRTTIAEPEVTSIAFLLHCYRLARGMIGWGHLN